MQKFKAPNDDETLRLWLLKRWELELWKLSLSNNKQEDNQSILLTGSADLGQEHQCLLPWHKRLELGVYRQVMGAIDWASEVTLRSQLTCHRMSCKPNGKELSVAHRIIQIESHWILPFQNQRDTRTHWDAMVLTEQEAGYGAPVLETFTPELCVLLKEPAHRGLPVHFHLQSASSVQHPGSRKTCRRNLSWMWTASSVIHNSFWKHSFTWGRKLACLVF